MRPASVAPTDRFLELRAFVDHLRGVVKHTKVPQPAISPMTSSVSPTDDLSPERERRSSDTSSSSRDEEASPKATTPIDDSRGTLARVPSLRRIARFGDLTAPSTMHAVPLKRSGLSGLLDDICTAEENQFPSLGGDDQPSSKRRRYE